jgi:hypothetical protein
MRRGSGRGRGDGEEMFLSYAPYNTVLQIAALSKLVL